MNIGYIGSCYSENFAEKVAKAKPLFKFFRVNTISLMDDRKVALPEFDIADQTLASHMKFENRKGFKDVCCRDDIDLIVIDFIRDVRCPVIDFGDGYLSFPYEMVGKWEKYKDQFGENTRLLRFGSKEYAEILMQNIDKMCAFFNEKLEKTNILLLDFMPTTVFEGKTISQDTFRNDYITWSLRYPAMKWLTNYAASQLKRGKVLRYDDFITSDDNAKYGPSSVHYSDSVWERMHRNFDFKTLAFVADSASSSIKDETLKNLCSSKDISDLSHAYSRHFADDGADVVPNIAEAMMKKIIYGVDFNRRPNLVDAFDAFYWILGRTPESTDTVVSHSTETSLAKLRERLLRSPEFSEKFYKLENKN